jgi:hypothetical protein
MWNGLRACKIVALLGFLLPWITISCSNQKIASASGLDLARGSIIVTNPISRASEVYHSGANAMLILAIVAIGTGLVLSFRPASLRTGALVALATSVAAVILCWVGTATIDSRSVGAAASKQKNGFDADIANTIIRVDYAYGFWITVIALAAAAFIAWQILRALGSAAVAPAPTHASNAPLAPD